MVYFLCLKFLWQCKEASFPWVQLLLCSLYPWLMCQCSMYSTLKRVWSLVNFNLNHYTIWCNPVQGSPTRSHSRAQPHLPLIWIKILEASWLTAFNHFDAALKRASLLMYAHWSFADARRDSIRLLLSAGGCISVWAGVTDVVHTGQIFMQIKITYHRKRAFLLLCSFPSNSQPCIRICQHPPVGNMGFPKHHWLSLCPLSWRMARHPPSSSLWKVLGCENRQNFHFLWKICYTSVASNLDKTS